MRKYPCSQCEYQATTQKSLKTHVPIVHNHPPWLTDIVTVIVRADPEDDSNMKLDNHQSQSLQGYLITSCLVFGLNVFLKMTLIWSLIITIIARIIDTFLFRLNVFQKMTLIWSLIITIITTFFVHCSLPDIVLGCFYCLFLSFNMINKT